MPRRRLLRRALAGGGLLITATVVSGCGLEGTREDPRTVRVLAREVPEIDGAPFVSTDGRFFLVRNTDGLLAMSWDCTHLGCRTTWSGENDRFECPCHAAKFTHDGSLIEGPALRPLDLFRISAIVDGEVHVIAGPRTMRDGYDPAQATPFEPAK